MDMSLGNELIKQRVPLFVSNLVLNRHKRVLQVHDSVLELHGAFGHVCLLPSCLYKFLLSLYLSLRDVFCGRLHVFNDLGLGLLEFRKVIVFLFSNHGLQFLQIVALRS